MQVSAIELIERNRGGGNSGPSRAVRGGRGDVSPGSDPAPHLLHVFPSYGHGGVPIRIATVINHFGSRYRHTILALDGNTAAESRLDPALRIPVGDPGIDKGRPVASFFRIRRMLAACRPDLLLTYNWGAVEWALANRFLRIAPHMHLESGFGPEEADGQIPRRVRFRRFALANIDRLLVPSDTLVSIARDIWRIDPGKVIHVPNGVDCALYAHPGDTAAAPGFVRREREVVVGTLAPLRPEKNLHRLLRAFARIAPRHDARVLIAGDGSERPGLETAARHLGIAERVVFVGHVEEPHKVYPLMDVFAISSDTEQMPNTLIQAMAASRPVAGVDVGDVKVNLSPANRELIVARSDETGFAAALDRLIADARLRAALAEANRRHVVDTYSAERMFAEYGKAFDSLIASGGS